MKYLFVTLIALGLSCKSQIVGTYDACMIAKTPEITFVQQNASLIFKNSEDSCIIELLDSLVEKSIKANDDQHLVSLESLALESDGYISDYFLEIADRLFYKDFEKFIDFIYKRKDDPQNVLEKILIEAISIELSDDPQERKDEVIRFIEIGERKYHFDNKKVDYLNRLVDRFDPGLFD